MRCVCVCVFRSRRSSSVVGGHAKPTTTSKRHATSNGCMDAAPIINSDDRIGWVAPKNNRSTGSHLAINQLASPKRLGESLVNVSHTTPTHTHTPPSSIQAADRPAIMKAAAAGVGAAAAASCGVAAAQSSLLTAAATPAGGGSKAGKQREKRLTEALLGLKQALLRGRPAPAAAAAAAPAPAAAAAVPRSALAAVVQACLLGAVLGGGDGGASAAPTVPPSVPVRVLAYQVREHNYDN